MTAALPTELTAALQELPGRRPVLVAGDYDGVLAPLVGDPAAAGWPTCSRSAA